MAPRRAATSIDVAKAAGVSRSAVSRTFTDGASVSTRTRERVMEAAAQLDYRPNAIARSLITQRSNIIGLVVSELTNPFFSGALEMISEKLQQNGQRVLLFSVTRAQDIDQALPALMQYQVDGVIVASALLSSEVAHRCAAAGRPVVLFDRYVPGADVSTVYTDDVGGGEIIADTLIDAGYRRLAFVAGTPDTSSSEDRQKGFVARVAARGLAAPQLAQGNFDYDCAKDAARRLLTSATPPDGVFCANDVMAMGVLDVARAECGLRIADDLGVVGFDDIPQARWAPYNLTTFRQDIDAMIDATLSILNARIANADLAAASRVVPGRLIVRETTRKRTVRPI